MYDKRYTFEEVDSLFGEENVITNKQRPLIVKILVLLPKPIIDQIVQEVMFVASHYGMLGFYQPLNATNIKNKKAIIFLSESLFKEKNEVIRNTVLHEVAHFCLRHKCKFDLQTTAELIEDQEKSANQLVDTWLKASHF